MVILLELIFQGFLEWTYGLILEMWEYFASMLLDVMSMDFSYLKAHIPILPTIQQTFLGVGWALLIGNLVLQAARSMMTGLGFEAEDPKLLFSRTFVFGFLLVASPQICELCLNMTSVILELIEMPDAVNITLADEATFGEMAASWLLVMICGIVVMFQSFKLIFAMAERYLILSVLTISSPLAFGVGGSRNTSDIFNGWCRMYGSMCLMMVLNVVFVKMLLSAMSFYPSGADVLPWMVLIIAIVKVAKKADSIVMKIGLNPAMTGDALGRSFPGALGLMVARTMISQTAQTVGRNIGSRNQSPGGSGAKGSGPMPKSPTSGAGGAANGPHTGAQGSKPNADSAQEQNIHAGASGSTGNPNAAANQKTRHSSVEPGTKRSPTHTATAKESAARANGFQTVQGAQGGKPSTTASINEQKSAAAKHSDANPRYSGVNSQTVQKEGRQPHKAASAEPGRSPEAAFGAERGGAAPSAAHSPPPTQEARFTQRSTAATAGNTTVQSNSSGRSPSASSQPQAYRQTPGTAGNAGANPPGGDNRYSNRPSRDSVRTPASQAVQNGTAGTPTAAAHTVQPQQSAAVPPAASVGSRQSADSRYTSRPASDPMQTPASRAVQNGTAGTPKAAAQTVQNQQSVSSVNAGTVIHSSSVGVSNSSSGVTRISGRNASASTNPLGGTPANAMTDNPKPAATPVHAPNPVSAGTDTASRRETAGATRQTARMPSEQMRSGAAAEGKKRTSDPARQEAAKASAQDRPKVGAAAPGLRHGAAGTSPLERRSAQTRQTARKPSPEKNAEQTEIAGAVTTETASNAINESVQEQETSSKEMMNDA